jgi:hypothetical protein
MNAYIFASRLRGGGGSGRETAPSSIRFGAGWAPDVVEREKSLPPARETFPSVVPPMFIELMRVFKSFKLSTTEHVPKAFLALTSLYLYE